jgi:hypothetical protein
MEKQGTRDCVEEAVEKIRANVEQNIKKFREQVAAKMAGRGEFSIDTVESIWGDILHGNEKVTEELMNEVVEEITEKQLIVKKKKK